MVMGSKSSWKRRTLLFSAASLALFATLELGSRAIVGQVEYPPDPFVTNQEAGRRHAREYDPLLFWRLKPGSGSEGDRANSLGLTGPEVPTRKEGEFRVLSLGESTTYGWRVPPDQCYSSLLEARLRETRDARVINAGSPGYSLVQGRIFLEYHGLDLLPDAVLIYFGANDFLEVAFREERDALSAQGSKALTDRELFLSRRRWTMRTSNWLFAHSNFLRWVGRRAGSKPPTVQDPTSGNGESEAERVATRPKLVRVPKEDRRAALDEMLEICRARGIDLIVIVPVYKFFNGHIGLLRRFATEHQLPIVDLPRAMAEQGAALGEIFADNVHPNAAGQRWMAEEIWKVVGDRWSQEPTLEVPR